MSPPEAALATAAAFAPFAPPRQITAATLGSPPRSAPSAHGGARDAAPPPALPQHAKRDVERALKLIESFEATAAKQRMMRRRARELDLAAAMHSLGTAHRYHTLRDGGSVTYPGGDGGGGGGGGGNGGGGDAAADGESGGMPPHHHKVMMGSGYPTYERAPSAGATSARARMQSAAAEAAAFEAGLRPEVANLLMDPRRRGKGGADKRRAASARGASRGRSSQSARRGAHLNGGGVELPYLQPVQQMAFRAS